MPFLLMLFLTLVCLPERWSQPGPWIPTPGVGFLLTWTTIAIHLGIALWIVRRVRRLVRGEPRYSDRASGFYSRARTWHSLGLLGLFTVCLYGFGWGWVVQSLWQHNDTALPLGDLLILAPLLTAMIMSWLVFYDAERTLHQANVEFFGLSMTGTTDAGYMRREEFNFWTRAGYLVFHLRQNLALVFIPVLLLIVEKEIRRYVPPEWQLGQGALMGLGSALLLFLGMPWMLKMVLGLTSLPPGPLRDRLEAASKRLNFRCTDILLWHTRGNIANAMVVGVCPWLRYVLLSDRLIEELTPDEIEAVFGHEVGHVKHNHMLFYLSFLLSSIFVMGLALTPLLANMEQVLELQARSDLMVLPLVVALGVYVILVFGYVSRRCERQADIYGCRVVSENLGLDERGIRTFVDALEKVGLLNGIHREKPGFLQWWQHSTIALRVAFLKEMIDDPTVEPRFQRRLLLLKCALLGVLALVFAGLVAWELLTTVST